MSEEEVLFRIEDGVGVITLNRHDRRNALTPGIRDGLIKYTSLADQDPSIRAVVLTGNGTAFCSGGDVGNFSVGEENRESREKRSSEIGSRSLSENHYGYIIRNSKKIFVGAINGHAVGAGFGLALSTDICIASESAKFGVFQLRRGIQPDGGLTYLLPRVVGTQKAFELAIKGSQGLTIDAQEALNIGVVMKVVTADQLMDDAMDLAKIIAKGSPIGFALAKRGFYNGTEWSFAEAINSEAEGVNYCFGTEDGAEGVRAFKEKRDPVFIGR
jgi:2-(1,2-epoxy-1,2-dihydrophenyl)acetyl-CoA isomerase